MQRPSRPVVLCVDDEPAILEGLRLNLGRKFELITSTKPREALALMPSHPEIAVVLADLRMPEIDGVTFLGAARRVAPDATRMLLTGNADVSTAVAAVNVGEIFRFLSKPCATSMLLAAVEAGVEQNRLVTSERVLLEETLHGCIKALTEVLALTSPLALGRAHRVKSLASSMAEVLGMPNRWHIEVAGLLSQLGYITLPPETAERAFNTRPLSPEEETMLQRVPSVPRILLGNIPRLEPVLDLLAQLEDPRPRPGRGDAGAEAVLRGGSILRASLAFEALERRGASADEALQAVRSAGEHPAEIIDALAKVRGAMAGRQVLQLSLKELQPGMVFCDDLHTANGALLVPRGFEVTPSFLARARNFRPGLVAEPVRVFGAKNIEVRRDADRTIRR